MSEPTTLLILGGSGDLAGRLLLPALGQLIAREPRREVRLLGAGVDDWDDERWRSRVKQSFATADADASFDAVADTTYTKADITSSDELAALLAKATGRVALYFAVPPRIAAAACEALKDVELPSGTILALEKPFGFDAASAHALNQTLTHLVPENQVFRVDHFLGRSSTLNLLGARFANRIFEPVWSAQHIEKVTIRFDETLGLENRARYYDNAGALTDMIQSHLLQLLAFVAMETPASLREIDLREATTAVLRATKVWEDSPIRSSRRARYTRGTIDGRELPDYADEPGVDPANQTETLAEATFEVRNSRWAGVPFTLRSGKALAENAHEVEVRFRKVHHLPEGFTGDEVGSRLRFSLGPDAMSLGLNVNGREDPFALSRARMSADLGLGALLAYAEVLSGILDGDATLAVRGDAAEHCWRIVQPVLDAWRRGDVPLEEYPAGSEGPARWRD